MHSAFLSRGREWYSEYVLSNGLASFFVPLFPSTFSVALALFLAHSALLQLGLLGMEGRESMMIERGEIHKERSIEGERVLKGQRA